MIAAVPWLVALVAVPVAILGFDRMVWWRLNGMMATQGPPTPYRWSLARVAACLPVWLLAGAAVAQRGGIPVAGVASWMLGAALIASVLAWQWLVYRDVCVGGG